jgi:hypothetical protein
MEEAPENGKESPHSAHANGIIISEIMWDTHAIFVCGEQRCLCFYHFVHSKDGKTKYPLLCLVS